MRALSESNTATPPLEVVRALDRHFADALHEVRSTPPFDQLAIGTWGVVVQLAVGWARGDAAPTQQQLATMTGCPVRSLRRILSDLDQAGAVKAVRDERSVGYHIGPTLEARLRDFAWGRDRDIWTRSPRLRETPTTLVAVRTPSASPANPAATTAGTVPATPKPSPSPANPAALTSGILVTTPTPSASPANAAAMTPANVAAASTPSASPANPAAMTSADVAAGPRANASSANPAAMTPANVAAASTPTASPANLAATTPATWAGPGSRSSLGPAPLGLSIAHNLERIRVSPPTEGPPAATTSDDGATGTPPAASVASPLSLIKKKIFNSPSSLSESAQPPAPMAAATVAAEPTESHKRLHADTLRAIACRALTARYRGGFPDRLPPATFAATDVEAVVAAMAGLALSEPDLDQLHLDAIAGASAKSKKQPPTVGFIWGNREYFLQNAADGRAARQAAARVAARKPRAPKPPEDPPATYAQLLVIAQTGMDVCDGKGEPAPRPKSARFLPVEEHALAASPTPPTPPTPEDSGDDS